jgi:hypothetical protein
MLQSKGFLLAALRLLKKLLAINVPKQSVVGWCRVHPGGDPFESFYAVFTKRSWRAF